MLANTLSRTVSNKPTLLLDVAAVSLSSKTARQITNTAIGPRKTAIAFAVTEGPVAFPSCW
jgi:hypothetical protein